MTAQGHYYELTFDLQNVKRTPKDKELLLKQIIDYLGRAFTIVKTNGTSVVVYAQAVLCIVVGKAKDIAIGLSIFVNLSGKPISA
jgi:hypothetical protein